MTDNPPRRWASAACMAGRPDDCPRIHPVDGRQCINPAHTAYPDGLGPGEQPTLDAEPPAAAEPTHIPVVMRRRRWTCDRCGDLVIRAEHVTGTRKDPFYACDPTPDGTPAGIRDALGYVDPNEGSDLDDRDPHDALAAAANLVGAFAHDMPGVIPYGNNPDSVDLADQVNAAVRAKGYAEPDPFAPTPTEAVTAELVKRVDVDIALEVLRAAGWVCWPTVVDPPALTSGEVKRITAAHLRLPLEPALDAVRTIIAERLTNPEGAS